MIIVGMVLKMSNKYKTIYADPPWNERGAGKIKRGADRDYELMKTEEIIDMKDFSSDKNINRKSGGSEISNVLLVDVDSKIPNLALMKISAYHKDHNDNVGFHVSDPDIVYASVVFTENEHRVDGLKFWYPDAEIRIGGSGYDISKKLPNEVEYIKPDYSLYPEIDYSIGFTTRGCIRSCDFCVVPKKEGKICRWQHPKNFHDEQFDKIKLLDNNILGDKEWFFEVTDWILDNEIKVEFNQGLDIRLLDQDIANRLVELNHYKTLKFAWDHPEDEEQIKQGIEQLRRADMDLRNKTQFYVLTNFDTTHKEDLYRCRKLKEWGTNPFVMMFKDGDEFTRHLARWANRKWILWSCDFTEYDKLPLKVRLELKSFD